MFNLLAQSKVFWRPISFLTYNKNADIFSSKHKLWYIKWNDIQWKLCIWKFFRLISMKIFLFLNFAHHFLKKIVGTKFQIIYWGSFTWCYKTFSNDCSFNLEFLMLKYLFNLIFYLANYFPRHRRMDNHNGIL